MPLLIILNNDSEFIQSGEGIHAYTSTRIDGWDPETYSWDFDWNDWFNKDTELIPFIKMNGNPGKALPWLTKNDVFVISELMRGPVEKMSKH